MSNDNVKTILNKIKDNEEVIDKMLRSQGKLVGSKDSVSVCIENITDSWFMEKSLEVKTRYIEKLSLKVLTFLNLCCKIEVYDKISFTDTFHSLFMTQIDFIKIYRPENINIGLAVVLTAAQGRLIIAMASVQDSKTLRTVSSVLNYK